MTALDGAGPASPPGAAEIGDGLVSDLQGANLGGAHLNFANLSSADLQDADLTNTDLDGAPGGITASVTAVAWNNTTCPDGTNSNSNTGNTCVGHGS